MTSELNCCPVCGDMVYGFVNLDAVQCPTHGVISGFVAFQLRGVPAGQKEEALKLLQATYYADHESVKEPATIESDAGRIWRVSRGFRR